MDELKREPRIQFLSPSELRDYRDPDADRIVIDEVNQTVTFDFLYPYEIDLDRIETERDLLAWTLHLTEKTWMNSHRLHRFITKVGRYKNLKIYGL